MLSNQNVQIQSGWGNYPPVPTKLVWQQSQHAPHKYIYRGLGKSYGDQAVCENGETLLNTRNNRILSFSGNELEVESGISLREIHDAVLPRGYMLPVCPGTEYITIGGAIANNVHGKGHHIDGSFIDHVVSFTLLTTSGQLLVCSRNQNTELFLANAGGCGLLGYIKTAKLRLQAVRSAFVEAKAYTAANFEQMLELLDTKGLESHFTVGWINMLNKHTAGVLSCANRHQVDNELDRSYLQLHVKEPFALPLAFPSGSLNKLSISVLNQAIAFSQKRQNGLVHFRKYFFPLDALSNWNLAYGKNGFLQLQFVVPLADGHQNLQLIINAIKGAGVVPFLNVIKRFGKAAPRFLSFPMEGYTLALDFAVSKKALELCKHLSNLVAQMGGRIYLAKDAVMDAEHLPAMYPELEQWKQLKHTYDPENKLQSAHAVRLQLC
ncbi:FAD-binding protein [bacterium]|nr:FAD-binding protein [bacterium]